LAAFCAIAGACTYDFDKYVTPQGNGAAGHASGAPGAGSGGSNAGRAGSSSAGTTSAHAGTGGSAVGGSSHAGASDGGATDDGGTGAIPSSGGSAGRGGTSTGGAGAGGTSAGGHTGAGAPSGGKAGSGTAGSASVECSDGTTHDGHCYFLVGTSGGLDWEHAKSECDTHDAHLVTITSSAEQMFVATTFFPSSDDAWIGLSLEDTRSNPSSLCSLAPDACPFLWVTAEKLDYDAWAMRSGDDEPNYTGACVRLQASDQAWADTGCSSEFRAVCERDR
jgi:hypothetical protein